MQKSKRLSMIYDYVKAHKDVLLVDLANHVNASQSTIRRDIKELAAQGLVLELYGSIVLNDKNDLDIQIKQRASMQSNEKKEIGMKAASLVRDDAFVFIDAGTTTKEMIPHIKAKNARFITNGVEIALELLKFGYEVQIVGGTLKPITEAVVGEFALEFIKTCHFDLSFIGANGVSETGYSTPDLKEGMIKKAVIVNSRMAYVLADQSKLGKVTSFIFSERKQAKWIHEGSE